jgi:protein disulfide-isomerase A6
MKPIYETVAKNFKPESDVRLFFIPCQLGLTSPIQCIVANIDADAQGNKPIASKYEIASFPTIKFFSKDHKESPEDYTGARTEAAFVEYLNEKCGTQRAVGGGLSDEVRWPWCFVVIMLLILCRSGWKAFGAGYTR